MDKTVLVSGVDLDKGAEILRILDGAGLRISVALWAYLPEYEDWRLVLSSRRFDSIRLPKAYGLLHDALDAAGFQLEKTPPVMIQALSDPFIRSLRRIFGKAKSVDGMRFGGQTIGDRFVDDALCVPNLLKFHKPHSNRQTSSKSSRGLRGNNCPASP
jgi:hypothetical protein